MSRLQEQLPGTWHLRSFLSTCEDGRTRQPLGPRPTGRLHYDRGGGMLAALAHTEQPPLGVSGLEQAATADVQARAAAFSRFVCYGGRWSVEGDSVLHHVELAAVADVLGKVHRRQATLEGDRLVLIYSHPSPSGKRWTHALSWQRSS